MRTTAVIIGAVALSGSLVAQENRPVPKDSVRVSIPGCTKRYIFTVGRRTPDEPGSDDVPEGTHFRMNGPKKMIAEIRAHEGSMIAIIGRSGTVRPGDSDMNLVRPSGRAAGTGRLGGARRATPAMPAA